MSGTSLDDGSLHMWLQTLLFQEFMFVLIGYLKIGGFTLVFMGLRKRTWDTGMLSLSCAASPKFDEDGTSSHTHTHTPHTHFAEKKRALLQTSTADEDRKPMDYGDLIATSTSSKLSH